MIQWKPYGTPATRAVSSRMHAVIRAKCHQITDLDAGTTPDLRISIADGQCNKDRVLRNTDERNARQVLLQIGEAQAMQHNLRQASMKPAAPGEDGIEFALRTNRSP